MYPLVSVVIPVLNAERFLGDALVSVDAQTYRNLEIVVIDGPSTDGTAHIAQSFPRVRYIRQTGAGLWNAVNEGVQAARGEFIAMISSDDQWAPDKTELQVQYLASHSETDHVLCLTRFVLVPGETAPRAFRAELLEGDRVAILLEALMARKTLFQRVGKFDESLKIASDVDWFARLANLHQPRGMIPRALLNKRIHAKNLSTDPTQRQVFRHDVLTAMHRQMQLRRAATE